MENQLKTICLCGRLWDIDDRVDEQEALFDARHGVPVCPECCHLDNTASYIKQE